MRLDTTKPDRSRASLIADRRGAAAFEFVIVYPILFLFIMLPLADLALASFQHISARQALHAFGQYLMYSPPDDLADTTGWQSTVEGKADDLGYPITSIQLMCGSAACSAANQVKPKYVTFQTSVTLNPFVLRDLLCPSTGPCTYPIAYSTRFQ